jgi:ABC-type dipeptide/oligopeptide/nickel transport system ATPase component
MAYLFPQGRTAAEIVRQFQANDWRSAIVGPHGSGKSTLVATIIPLIEQMGIAVRRISLHDGQRRFPADLLQQCLPISRREVPSDEISNSTPRALLVIDGYEQLTWWSRHRLSACCRRNEWALLVTAHADSGLGKIPVLFRTAASLPTVQHLVDDMLPSHYGLIHADEVAAAFNDHGGNVRETLFALYHLFEQRRNTYGKQRAGESVRL